MFFLKKDVGNISEGRKLVKRIQSLRISESEFVYVYVFFKHCKRVLENDDTWPDQI